MMDADSFSLFDCFCVHGFAGVEIVLMLANSGCVYRDILI